MVVKPPQPEGGQPLVTPPSEGEGFKAPPAAEYEAGVTSAIDELLGDLDLDDDLPVAPLEDEPAATEEEVEEEATEQNTEGEADAPEDGDEPAAISDERKQAVQALAAKGLSPELLESWPDDAVLAEAKRREKNDADWARMKEELSKRPEERVASNEDKPAPPEPVSLDEQTRALAEVLDDESAPAVAKAAKSIADLAVKPLQQQLDQSTKLIHGLSGLVSSLLMGNVKATISSELGEISEADWKTVTNTYSEIAKTSMHGELSGIDRATALMRSAIKAADVTPTKPKTTKPQLAQKRKQGSPKVAQRSTPKANANDTYEDQVDRTISDLVNRL